MQTRHASVQPSSSQAHSTLCPHSRQSPPQSHNGTGTVGVPSVTRWARRQSGGTRPSRRSTRALTETDAYWSVDLGDNVIAGASGDVPFVCRSLFALTSAHRAQGQPRVLIAGLVDRGAVEVCAAAVAAGRPCLPQISVGASHAVGASYGDGRERLMLRDATVLGMVIDGAWAVQRAAWAFFGPNDIELLTSSFNPANYDVVVLKRGNVESLAFAMLPSVPPVDHPGASLAARSVVRSTRCLMARTPGVNAYPMPPRPHLRPGMFPLCDEREWVAPLGTCPAHDKEGNMAT